VTGHHHELAEIHCEVEPIGRLDREIECLLQPLRGLAGPVEHSQGPAELHEQLRAQARRGRFRHGPLEAGDGRFRRPAGQRGGRGGPQLVDDPRIGGRGCREEMRDELLGRYSIGRQHQGCSLVGHRPDGFGRVVVHR
jgi:hypothetical protein